MAALGLGLKEQAVGATGLCTGKAARKRRTNDRIGFKVLFSIGVAQVPTAFLYPALTKSPMSSCVQEKKNLPMTLQVESTRIQLDSQIRAELKIHGLSLLTPSIRVKAGHRILT